MPGFEFDDPPPEPEDFRRADGTPENVIDFTLEESTFTVGARLCNFPTGKSSLRSSYAQWAREKLDRFLLPGKDSSFEIRGHASRLGTSGANQTLSEARLNAVQAFLADRAKAKQANVQFRLTKARGEEEAEKDFGVADNTNSGFFRAVEVRHFAKKEPPIVLAKPKFPRPLGSTKFAIAFLEGVGTSAGPFYGRGPLVHHRGYARYEQQDRGRVQICRKGVWRVLQKAGQADPTSFGQ